MAEKFCLKWNDFQTNAANSFRELRSDDDFHDVTLVSDDKHQVSAHKVALSASSSYFKTILKSNKHSHPMLCLQGVNSEDLKNILDYIYNGEIQIFQDQLDQFLNIAQRFQLEGLMQGGEEKAEQLDTEKFEREASHENVNNSGKHLIAKYDLGNKVQKTKKERIITVQSANYDNIEDLDRKIEELLERMPDGKYQCTTCGKVTPRRRDGIEHAETHFDGLSFPCKYCQKSFISRRSLRRHESNCQQSNEQIVDVYKKIVCNQVASST